ncbi:unnamed protein product [Effrenium voratum]|nr:unnamed protein product [Effrenium voratum]
MLFPSCEGGAGRHNCLLRPTAPSVSDCWWLRAWLREALQLLRLHSSVRIIVLVLPRSLMRLTSLGDMIEFLDDAMINDKIFPECVNGFTDSNGPIREATVRSMIFFVPRLKPKTVESRVLKLLVKMIQDPEASIRTNALICVGRVSGGLPAASVNQTLLTVIGAGLKEIPSVLADALPSRRSLQLRTISRQRSWRKSFFLEFAAASWILIRQCQMWPLPRCPKCRRS